MTRPTDLIPGRCYFDVKYYDNDLLVPSIDTWIFDGSELDGEGRRMWMFHAPRGDRDDEDEPLELCGYYDDQLSCILDISQLGTVLKELAQLEPFNAPRPPMPVGVSKAAQIVLRQAISQFIDRKDASYVSISIGFVSQGFSIGRRENSSLEMGFFPKTLRDDADKNLIALFQARGVAPHVDYLADRGRTRVLDFAAPQTVEELVSLSIQILIDVYSMRLEDELSFSIRDKSRSSS